MTGMSDGVSKVWVQHFDGSMRIEGFKDDETAAMALAYRSLIARNPTDVASAKVEAFANELRDLLRDDMASEAADEEGEGGEGPDDDGRDE